MAKLIDILIEGHTNKADYIGAMAFFGPVGHRTGGDLVGTELGMRCDFKSGSICHLRGHELRHLIMPYEGKRICFVSTNHEDIRKLITRPAKLADEEKTEAPEKYKDKACCRLSTPSASRSKAGKRSELEPKPCLLKGWDPMLQAGSRHKA